MKPLHALVALAVAVPSFGQTPAAPPGGWEAVFRSSDVGTPPVGFYRGTVLSSDDSFPRARVVLQNLIFRGKQFQADGTFTTVFAGGVRIPGTDTGIGSSVLDGRPVLFWDYRGKYPILGRDYDELREMSPGVWLGHRYDGPTGRSRNWYTLQAR